MEPAIIHVNVHSAGPDGRVQVLSHSFHSQNISAFLPWSLDHQLGVEHSLLTHLLPRVLQFLIHPAAHWGGQCSNAIKI